MLGRTTSRIGLSEAWRLSKIPYNELVYRSLVQSRGTAGFYSPITSGDSTKSSLSKDKMIRRIIQSAKWNKSVVALVVAFASSIPMIGFVIRPSEGALLGGSSLGLLMLLGYCILYGIQILPGLVSAESLATLETLPLSNEDVSLIATFSFFRTIDYILLAGIATPTILMGILTHTFWAAFVELIGSLVNMIFAVAISLYLARLFYKNLSSGIRSRVESILRLSFVLMWGLLIMGLGFFFNYVSYVTPLIENAFQKNDVLTLSFLSILHPFSFSFVLTSSIYSTPSTFFFISIISICLYTISALFAFKWSLSVTSALKSSKFSKIKRQVVDDFRLLVLQPVLAYILKDFRIAYRNPSTAFLVAAPVFETIVVTLPLVSANIVGTLPTLVGTFIGGLFSSFTTFGLLNAEGAGFEYSKTLPIPLKTTIRAKAITATLTFLPIPFVFTILSYFKPMTYNLLYMVPIVSIFSVASASMAEISVFLAMAGEGRMVAFNASSGMFQFLLAMLVGSTIVGAPLMSFGIMQIYFRLVWLSLQASTMLAVLEFIIIYTLVSQTIK